jgi:sodium transport system ATP-binding protein
VISHCYNGLVIRAQGLTKRYGPKTAVEGLSLKVERGEVYALLGPNGAGKTTTLRMLATLVRPTAGRAEVAGFDVWKEPLEVRRRLGLVNGGMRVYDRLTGREVLAFFASFYGLEGRAFKEALDWVVALLEMEETLEKKVLEMSTGMRQKVVIARAILHRPPVLLLDEATAGLDVFARRALLDFVKTLPGPGEHRPLLYPRHARGRGGGRPGGLFAPGRLVYEEARRKLWPWGKEAWREPLSER